MLYLMCLPFLAKKSIQLNGSFDFPQLLASSVDYLPQVVHQLQSSTFVVDVMVDHEIIGAMNQNPSTMVEANCFQSFGEAKQIDVDLLNNLVESDDTYATPVGSEPGVAPSFNIGHAMQMRAKSWIVKPNPKYALFIEIVNVIEQNSIKEALQHDG